jgi:hypothetical protein
MRLGTLDGLVPDLVQLVLQGIKLPFDLLKGTALWGDEQASVLAPNVSQKSNPDRCRVVGSAVLNVQLKGAEDVHEGVSYPSKAGL